MAFERKHDALLSRRAFARRVAVRATFAAGVVALCLGIGMLGYHRFAGLPWIDSLYNAAMILTGMGPVEPLPSDGAKLFATVYALFSGVVFLTSVALVLAPLVHRFLHRFHLDETDDDAPEPSAGDSGRSR